MSCRKDKANRVVCYRINYIELTEKQKFEEFTTERLIKQSKGLDDTLPKNRVPFCNYKPLLQSKYITEAATLRSNVELFLQQYVANQLRNGDMGNSLSHKNTSIPPSLSKNSKLRLGNKSDLLDILCDFCRTQDSRPCYCY